MGTGVGVGSEGRKMGGDVDGKVKGIYDGIYKDAMVREFEGGR